MEQVKWCVVLEADGTYVIYSEDNVPEESNVVFTCDAVEDALEYLVEKAYG